MWSEVPEFPNYRAHHKGRIRHKNSRVDRKPMDNGAALTISLHDSVTGRMTTRNLGALVLSAFVGPRPDGGTCSHVNGDYRDNRIDNLRWETQAENCLRKFGHGTQPGKLTEDDVREIRRRVAAGESQRSVARDYQVWQSTVNGIVRGKTWRHVV